MSPSWPKLVSQVVEVCRPKRAANRGGRKTDMRDASRAAKEALLASRT
ncbi:hypothetical protein AB0H69_48970 [Streptomyces phaeochromogenes]